MVQYATFFLLGMSTHFYIIPSIFAATTPLLPTSIPTAADTTVLLTSPKPPTATKPPVPTTTSTSTALTTTTTTSPTSTISITVPTSKSLPSTPVESDVNTQGVELTTSLTNDEFDKPPGGEISELLQPENLGDAVTADVIETVTSSSPDVRNSTTADDTAESTEEAQTLPATTPSASEPTSSSKTETPESTASTQTETSESTSLSNTSSSTSGNGQNATTVSHMTSKRTSTSTDSETTPTMTTDKTSTEVTKTSSGKIGSMFGTTGLPVIIGLLAICAFLLIIIIILTIRASKSSRHKPQHADDKSVPKLQLLEIRDEKAKRNNHDDLQTFSLDYEKHVQEKIEEHKRKSQAPPKAEKPGVGVSTFMQKKKQSLRSNQSVSSYGSSPSPLSPVSPSSPSSPAEHKPLIQQPDDEPVVFNFAKRPSDLLTARRTSALDDAGRRRSNASGQKTPKLALPENELFDI